MQKWEYLGLRLRDWGIALSKPEELDWLTDKHPEGKLIEDAKNIRFETEFSWREYYDFVDRLGEVGWEMVEREEDGLIFKRPIES